MERPTSPRGPQGIERLAEARIQAAMDAGEFDNLPGRGAPLQLQDDSLIDPAWRLAFRVLKGAGMAPAWIEIRRELDQEIELARAGLAAVAVGDPGRSEAERRFTGVALDLNHRIARLNLLVPGPRWTKPSIDIEVEISRLGVVAPAAAGLPETRFLARWRRPAPSDRLTC
jgi:hypothetical protein